MDQLLRKESKVEQAIGPGHERTKDLVNDQSPDSVMGNTGVLPAEELVRRLEKVPGTFLG